MLVVCARAGRRRAEVPQPAVPLSKWKIADNLRRSVVPIALLLLLLAGWFVLPLPLAWTVVVLVIVLAYRPWSIRCCSWCGSRAMWCCASTSRRPCSRPRRNGHRRASPRLPAARGRQQRRRDTAHTWRVLVSHRRLLQWSPFGEQMRMARRGCSESVRSMWIAPALALSTGAYLMVARPSVLLLVAPILLLWLAAPGVAWWVSRPLARPRAGTQS